MSDLLYAIVILLLLANMWLVPALFKYKRLLKKATDLAVPFPPSDIEIKSPGRKWVPLRTPMILGPMANEHATANTYVYCLDMRLYPDRLTSEGPCHLRWPDSKGKWCSGCADFVEMNTQCRGPTGPKCPPGLDTILGGGDREKIR
jgi:hypothetical protein